MPHSMHEDDEKKELEKKELEKRQYELENEVEDFLPQDLFDISTENDEEDEEDEEDKDEYSLRLMVRPGVALMIYDKAKQNASSDHNIPQEIEKILKPVFLKKNYLTAELISTWDIDRLHGPEYQAVKTAAIKVCKKLEEYPTEYRDIFFNDNKKYKIGKETIDAKNFDRLLQGKVDALWRQIKALERKITHYKEKGSLYRFFNFLPHMYYQNEIRIKYAKHDFLNQLLQRVKGNLGGSLVEAYSFLYKLGGIQSETGELFYAAIALGKISPELLNHFHRASESVAQRQLIEHGLNTEREVDELIEKYNKDKDKQTSTSKKNP